VACVDDAGFFPETERLNDVFKYCMNNTSSCRLSLILQHFGESCTKKACDRKAKYDNCHQCVICFHCLFVFNCCINSGLVFFRTI
jgi:hypothetical protein